MAEPTLWQLRITAPRDLADAIAACLERAEVPEPVSVSAFENRNHTTWRIDALYTKQPRRRDILLLLSEFLADAKFQIGQVKPQDWVSRSQENLKPILAGRFFVSQNRYRAEAPADAVPLIIEAAQAFGTGHHGTTQGCLTAIHDLAITLRANSILDLGCGSGVLAIASAKVWRVPVVASDLDPLCCQAAASNARANDVRPQIKIIRANGFQHAALHHRRFDLILANLLARPLRLLAPAVKKHLASGGVVVLSGLLAQQERRVRSAYHHQKMRLRTRYVFDDWVTLVYQH